MAGVFGADTTDQLEVSTSSSSTSQPKDNFLIFQDCCEFINFTLIVVHLICHLGFEEWPLKINARNEIRGPTRTSYEHSKLAIETFNLLVVLHVPIV